LAIFVPETGTYIPTKDVLIILPDLPIVSSLKSVDWMKMSADVEGEGLSQPHNHENDNAENDEDDEPLTLSSETFAALAEFYSEQEQREQVKEFF
jgi:hypothetical protein